MDGRTDRHDEANICFSQFCERAEHCTAELDEVWGGLPKFFESTPALFFILYQTGVSVVAIFKALFFFLELHLL